MSSVYYEDYTPDWTLETLGRTITTWDILQFVTTTGMNEQLFLNEEYILNETPFKKRIAPGALMFSYAEGLVIQTGMLHDVGMAFLSSDVNIQRPLEEGDTISVTVTLTAKRETSKPDRGLVTTENRVLNQHGQVVMVYHPQRMIKKRVSG
ncbi:MAG: MaoC family dehydratase N-terminal domain-containing protein [Gammaproteobacteria bacterium]|nr:MaoC family dehydratase N-terminal domain-containing protein [Gammaproteobacteria bacterium]